MITSQLPAIINAFYEEIYLGMEINQGTQKKGRTRMILLICLKNAAKTLTLQTV